MRKIYLSMLMICLAAALVGGATFAWYTDVETNNDNTFASGTVDVVLTDSSDGVITNQPLFNLTNIYPGWTGDRVAFNLENRSSFVGAGGAGEAGADSIGVKFGFDFVVNASDANDVALYEGLWVKYEIDGPGGISGECSLKDFITKLEQWETGTIDGETVDNTFPLEQVYDPDNYQRLVFEVTPSLPETADNTSQDGSVGIDMTVKAVQSNGVFTDQSDAAGDTGVVYTTP